MTDHCLQLTQSEQREKTERGKRKSKSSEISKTITKIKIYIIWDPEGDEKEFGAEKVFDEERKTDYSG